MVVFGWGTGARGQMSSHDFDAGDEKKLRTPTKHGNPIIGGAAWTTQLRTSTFIGTRLLMYVIACGAAGAIIAGRFAHPCCSVAGHDSYTGCEGARAAGRSY